MMPAHGQSCTVQLGVPVGAAAGGEREALGSLRSDPMRTRDTGFALRLADEVAPSSAAAHTALLALRNLCSGRGRQPRWLSQQVA
ncbi:hypothetical protein F7R02_19475 [Xanthomonas cissicola]|nr:hypothetical protein F7R02_19475 [Xanthomonas cissicola]